MTGSLTPLAGLLCDDVRFEADGRYSLMGLVPAALTVVAFPARQRVHAVVLFRADKPGTCVVGTGLRWRGELRWQVETELEITEAGGCTAVPMGNTVAGFDQEGELALEVTINGKTTVVATFGIQQDETISDEAEAPESDRRT